MSRTGEVERQTGETEVEVKFVVDGMGASDVDTGVGFLDHMIESLAKHGLFDVRVHADGDVERTGDHHTVEDVGITLGMAIDDALGDRESIRRFGDASAPLDEALSRVVVDVSGRPYTSVDTEFTHAKIADMSTDMVPHFFRSLATNAGLTLHMESEGENDHHIAESMFKSFALALDEATGIDERRDGVPSTKGKI
ncbi:MAG: imidazoleglycerol-phosphate dehydratase HisB [Halobacteria archaeon]|nr:imidazoleglycerol-phosphate dehydratase HisB [Halobacteria archaeon]